MGHNERLVAKALASWPGGRDGVLVATKGGHTRPGREWGLDGRPEHLRQACEASLRALGVEAIGLYQLHRPDPKVPFAESVGALAELRAAGKVRMVGLSNVSVDQNPAFAEVAGRHGVSPQQVALAWELAKAPVVIPIPGARRPETIADSAAAATLRLDADELDRLDAL